MGTICLVLSNNMYNISLKLCAYFMGVSCYVVIVWAVQGGRGGGGGWWCRNNLTSSYK